MTCYPKTYSSNSLRNNNSLVEAMPERQILIPTNRNSRGHNMKFRTPYCRTDVMKKPFFPSAISLWNSLPQEAISANTPEAFRTTVEGWLQERSHKTTMPTAPPPPCKFFFHCPVLGKKKNRQVYSIGFSQEMTNLSGNDQFTAVQQHYQFAI